MSAKIDLCLEDTLLQTPYRNFVAFVIEMVAASLLLAEAPYWKILVAALEDNLLDKSCFGLVGIVGFV